MLCYLLLKVDGSLQKVLPAFLSFYGVKVRFLEQIVLIIDLGTKLSHLSLLDLIRITKARVGKQACS